MNLYQFMSDSPVLTFFIILLLGMIIETVVKNTFRGINIRKHGWPTEHSDTNIKSKDDSI